MKPAENPFRTSRLDALRYRPTNWPETLERFEELGRFVSVVGPQGSGKTAFMMAMIRAVIRNGGTANYLRLGIERSPVFALVRALRQSVGAILFVDDGADRVPSMVWWLVKRLALTRGLVVSAHKQIALPALKTCIPTYALFACLASELDSAGLLKETDFQTAYRLAKGNFREAFLILFDVVAEKERAYRIGAIAQSQSVLQIPGMGIIDRDSTVPSRHHRISQGTSESGY